MTPLTTGGENEGAPMVLISRNLADAHISLYPAAFATNEADALFRELLGGVEWRQETINLFGRHARVPRLTAWYGDAPYSYSGLTMQPEPWTAQLLAIKVRTEQLSGHRFNCVLLNRYRTGRDSMSWHSDDEPELGPNPAISSVSFGASRRFRLRHRTRKEEKFAIELSHGSLLVMDQATQLHWQHSVSKTAKPVGERINLTFRLIRA